VSISFSQGGPSGRPLVLLAMAAVLLLGGCATTQQRGYELETAQRAYLRAARWGDWAVLRSFHRSLDADAVALMHEQSRNLRMSAYTVLEGNADLENGTAWQVVEFGYYRVDSNIERHVVDKQSWVYDQDRSVWFVDSPFPRLD